MNILKRLVASILCVGSFAVSARVSMPGDVLGRELQAPGFGWLGHISLATRSMFDPSGMPYAADLVIEVLNENPVGQINAISSFKMRSKYWGSKYGVADYGVRGYRMLVEANQQRWWCPAYTLQTDYKPGVGVPPSGTIISCGRWRCDTFVWWLYLTQGWNLSPGGYFTPAYLFGRLPFVNNQGLLPEENMSLWEEKRTLHDVNAEALNSMTHETIQKIMDNPSPNYVNDPDYDYMRFAENEEVKPVIRGMMIDRVASRAEDYTVIDKFIAIYDKAQDKEVKSKIIENVMLYNQSHINEERYKEKTLETVREFFERLMKDKSLNERENDTAIRGFMDTHAPKEILAIRTDIDDKLAHTHPTSSIMLKYALIFKSEELQGAYAESLINELRSNNNSDLDSYLFGPLSIAFQQKNDFLSEKSKEVIKEYLAEVKDKYSEKGINSSAEDFTRSTTAPYHAALSQALGVK